METCKSMSEPALIDIHNATIWRGTTRVFDSLNLTIEQHERVAILGPNGSGKTTLLKTINREIYPVVAADSYVRILGKEHWNVWDLRRHIGFVAQMLTVFSDAVFAEQQFNDFLRMCQSIAPASQTGFTKPSDPVRVPG